MTKAKKPRTIIRRLIRNWAVPVGCGLLFLFLLKFVFFFGYVPSDSMEPTLKTGSFILGTRMFGELQHGDIVVLEHENRLLVKRIAGVPGDVVIIGTTNRTVPDGCYFMLGDNAEQSSDSRTWEEPFVRANKIHAVIFAAR